MAKDELTKARGAWDACRKDREGSGKMPSYDKVEQASEHDTTTLELDHIKDGITQKYFE